MRLKPLTKIGVKCKGLHKIRDLNIGEEYDIKIFYQDKSIIFKTKEYFPKGNSKPHTYIITISNYSSPDINQFLSMAMDEDFKAEIRIITSHSN